MHKKIGLVLVILSLFIAGCGSNEPSIVGSAVTDVIMVPAIPDGVYTMDTSQSTLTYEAAKVGGSNHIGNVGISNGKLTIQNDIVEGIALIDMTSITETKNNERFLGHINGEDFFDVTNHPTALFTLTGLEKTDKGYTAVGDLTIKDITKSITFDAIVKTGDTLRMTAEFDINRLDWDITFNSGSLFKELGDKAIKDDITFGFDLVFT